MAFGKKIKKTAKKIWFGKVKRRRQTDLPTKAQAEKFGLLQSDLKHRVSNDYGVKMSFFGFEAGLVKKLGKIYLDKHLNLAEKQAAALGELRKAHSEEKNKEMKEKLARRVESEEKLFLRWLKANPSEVRRLP